MPDQPNDNIFGTTETINAGDAISQIQSEEIRRLQERAANPGDANQVAEAAPVYSTTPPSLGSDFIQQEKARAVSARADAAQFAAEAAQHRAEAARLRTYHVVSRSSWDADAANARAAAWGAARPVYSTGNADPPSILSAPANSNDFFSENIYDTGSARHTDYYVGGVSASDPGDPWQSVSERGRVDSGLASRVAEITGQRATPPPGRAAPRYASYEEAEQARTDIHADARNLYTTRGDFAKIGNSPEWEQDIADAEIAGGLRNAPHEHRGLARIGANVAEDWAEPYGKLNYGYALAQFGQGAAQYYEKSNVGNYLTPEQQTSAQSAMLPGVGAILGTAIGSAIAPGVGSWVGGMIGGGAGQLGQGIISANEERAQSTRESAERLAAALGTAASSVDSFKTQIEATGTPVQQFAASLGAVGGIGTFGPGTVAGVGALTNSFGEYAGEGFQTIARYTSSPLLYGLGNRFSSGQAGSGDITALAYSAAEQGDFSGLKEFQARARDASTKNDPDYQAAASAKTGASNPWLSILLGPLATHFQSSGAQNVMDKRRQADVSATDPTTDAENTLINQFADLKSQGIVAESALKSAGIGISLTEAQGGGSVRMAAADQALFAATAAGRRSTQGEISLLSADLANPVNASRKDELTARIADAQARLSGYDLTDAEAQRKVFTTGLEEDDSRYSRTQADQQQALARGYYGGRTFAQLQGAENSILSTDTARAAEIRRSAANPLVPPAERDRMLGEATSLETGVLRQRHDYQQEVERQAIQVQDLNIGTASANVAQARAFGSADQVTGAQRQEAETLAAKMRELASEMNRGGLTADEMAGKIREYNQAGTQMTQVLAQQRDEQNANREAAAQDTLTITTAGQSRQIRMGGTASVDVGQVESGYAGILSADRDRINAYAPGSRDRADAEAKLATDTARRADAMDALNVYDPGAATRTADIRAESALRRAETGFAMEELAPYRSGTPGSSPFTRGLTLERTLQSDMARLGRDQAGEDTFRAQRQKAGQWSDLAEEGYQSDTERRAEQTDQERLRLAQVQHDRNWEMEKALPTLLAGMPGHGISVSEIGFDALTARFAPSAAHGSWGGPARPGGVSVAGSLPGNTFDAFQSHAQTQTGSVSTVSAALHALAHGMNGAQLAGLLQQLVQSSRTIETMMRSSQRLPPQNGPASSSAGAVKRDLSNSFNPARPGR